MVELAKADPEASAPKAAETEPSRVRSRGSRFAWLSLVVAAALVGLPLGAGGIWDPYELRSLELARRIALNLFAASGLELQGESNALPSRGELDRGELPFTSMALGLRVFGLEAWAGRLPLFVWAFGGLAATYLLVARLVDRTAAALSVLVLATMPLYFLNARTMLGDAVAFAAFAMAIAGLFLALHDRGSARVRAGFGALGALGLVSGALSCGVIFGVGLPAFALGLSFFLMRSRGGEREPKREAVAGLYLAIGALALALGVRELAHAVEEPERYFAWLGFAVTVPAKVPTFDVVVGELGPALFPWSALAPLALLRFRGFEFSTPAEHSLRVALSLVAVATFFVTTLVSNVATPPPFVALSSLAVLVALFLRDADRGFSPSLASTLAVAALALLLSLDWSNLPDKALRGFGVVGAQMPEHGGALSVTPLLVLAIVAGALFFLSLLESERPLGPAFVRDDYARYLRTLRDLWSGNLLFGLLVLEAALLGFVAFDLLGERFPSLGRYLSPVQIGRGLGRYGWLVPPLLVALPLGVLAARDTFRALDALRERSTLPLPERGSFAALGFVLLGSYLSLSYFPRVSALLSPEQAFAAFHRFATPEAELAVLGPSRSTAPYYAGKPVTTLDAVASADEWLHQPGPRRFLILRGADLAELNAAYRSRHAPNNLPILDSSSSEALLAVNRLEPGERNQNALDRVLLPAPPRPLTRVDANLGGQLEVLGWEITNLDDEPVRSVEPGRRYRFVIYYRVQARIAGNWETFVHIDGFQRRFNADHPTLGDRYPLKLWRPGDDIADRHEFMLEPNFAPGEYRVYFGLYSGSRRLAVRRGKAQDDRVEAGTLLVR
jgi:4-amino-4-deoxy-L-arabinose transferase-like glycosyltransferase